MGLWLFLGAFAAVAAGIAVGYFILKKKIREFSRQNFGTPDLIQGLEKVRIEAEETPRSLNGCDSLLLPQILADFPDFDITVVKTYARDKLTEQYGGKPEFKIYNVVISRYLRAAVQKTIVLQAALSYRENGSTCQKRYEMNYTYIVSGATEAVAANCPNCGGVLSYGQTHCPYCGARVTNALKQAWRFTEIREK